jgi:hypothetical protein
MSRSWQSDVQLNYQTNNAATTALSWIINSFYFEYRSPIRTTKQLYQSDPIRNEYFCSEMRTNPIGSDSDRICTPLVESQPDRRIAYIRYSCLHNKAQLAFLTPPFLGGSLFRTVIASSANETFYNYSCKYIIIINRFTVKYLKNYFHIA